MASGSAAALSQRSDEDVTDQRRDVKEKSQTPRFSLATACTSAEWTIDTRSHTSGTAGASAVTVRSTSAQASARAAGRVSFAARSIAALTAGSSSSDQFVLPSGVMCAPLNVGSRNVWPSAKSRVQPTLGQTATCADGTPQNRVMTTYCD